MEEISPVLPEDLFINEILLRLSVKSLSRSLCVSKSWQSLLSSPQFVKSHIKFHFHDPPENIIFTDYSGDSVYTATLANGGASRKVILPMVEPRIKWHGMIVDGSCHGLVLLRKDNLPWQSSMLLMNPVTLDAVKIPTFFRQGYFAWGLGYDSFTEDYKFLILSRMDKKSELGLDCRVDIYGVKGKTQKKVLYSTYNQNCDPHDRCGVFVNGCIHWLFNEDDNIGAFSLAREEFKKLDLPRGVDRKAGFGCGGLYVLGGCLALNFAAVESFPFFDVWMMKTYGARDSWTKLRVWCDNVLESIVQIPKVICLLGDDEILMVKDKQLVAYSSINGYWRDVVIDGFPHRYVYCVTAFIGSLVSPNYKQYI